MIFLILFFLLQIHLSFSQEVPNSYQPLLSAMKEYKQQDFKKTLYDFLKTEKLFPSNSNIPFYIGLTYLKLNQKERAISYFRKTIKINPQYSDAYFQLGMVLSGEKRYGKAAYYLKKLYKLQPDRENIGYFLGYAYYNLRDFKKALFYFGKNKTKNKSIKQLNLYYSGVCKLGLKKAKEAKSFFNEVIKINSASPLASTSRQLLKRKFVFPKEKRFNFELATRFQYDDNLILVPTTNIYNLRGKKRKTTILFKSCLEVEGKGS